MGLLYPTSLAHCSPTNSTCTTPTYMINSKGLTMNDVEKLEDSDEILQELIIPVRGIEEDSAHWEGVASELEQ